MYATLWGKCLRQDRGSKGFLTGKPGPRFKKLIYEKKGKSRY